MIVINKNQLKKECNRLINDEGLNINEAIDKIYNIISSDDCLLVGFNGIYVYMGTYKLDNKEFPINTTFVDEKDPNKEYKLFYELDTGLSKYVNIKEELKDFENNNTIVYIPNVRNYESEYTFIEDFKKLRKIYLKELCTNNEEDAIKLITNENFIKKTFSVENYFKSLNLNPMFFTSFYNAALCNQKEKKNTVVLKKTLK